MLRRFVSESLSEQRSYRRDGSVHFGGTQSVVRHLRGRGRRIQSRHSILAGITVFLGGFAFGSWVPCSDESRDRP